MIALAPTAAPAGVSATTWETVLDNARNVFEHRDEACWGLGYLVDSLVHDSAPTGDEKPAARRKRIRGLITALASGIKMPNSNTLAGYYRTYAFYPPRVQDDYPTLSYSHFREAAKKKHGLDQRAALAMLFQANDADESVAELRRRITGAPRQEKTMTRRFEAMFGHIAWETPERTTNVVLHLSPTASKELEGLLDKPGFRARLVVEYDEAVTT